MIHINAISEHLLELLAFSASLSRLNPFAMQYLISVSQRTQPFGMQL